MLGSQVFKGTETRGFKAVLGKQAFKVALSRMVGSVLRVSLHLIFHVSFKRVPSDELQVVFPLFGDVLTSHSVSSLF